MTCGSPSRWHVSRAAITASGEQQARSALGPAGSSQRRSVTPIAFGAARRSATALSTPPLIATATRPGAGAAVKTGPIAFASASAASVSPGTAAASSRVRPVERPREARSVGLDDAVAVDEQPHSGVVVAAGGVADQLERWHGMRLAGLQAVSVAGGPARRPAKGITGTHSSINHPRAPRCPGDTVSGIP